MPYLKVVASLSLAKSEMALRGAISSSVLTAKAVGPVSFSGSLMPNFWRAMVSRVFLKTPTAPPFSLTLARRVLISSAERPWY